MALLCAVTAQIILRNLLWLPLLWAGWLGCTISRSLAAVGILWFCDVDIHVKWQVWFIILLVSCFLPQQIHHFTGCQPKGRQFRRELRASLIHGDRMLIHGSLHPPSTDWWAEEWSLIRHNPKSAVSEFRALMSQRDLQIWILWIPVIVSSASFLIIHWEMGKGSLSKAVSSAVMDNSLVYTALWELKDTRALSQSWCSWKSSSGVSSWRIKYK